ncbi:hypothetical protein HDZ31DRAFT_73849 [Schizophyllum fasciatum]
MTVDPGIQPTVHLSLDIPRNAVNRLCIRQGPKDQSLVIHSLDGGETTVSVSGLVTYDFQLLDSEFSENKDEARSGDSAKSDNESETTAHSPATNQSPTVSASAKHDPGALEAVEVLESLRSILETPRDRIPRMFGRDVEEEFGGDDADASGAKAAYPSQSFLSVPPVRGRPEDVRSMLRSLRSMGGTGSMSSARQQRAPSADREQFVRPGTHRRVSRFERRDDDDLGRGRSPSTEHSKPASFMERIRPSTPHIHQRIESPEQPAPRLRIPVQFNGQDGSNFSAHVYSPPADIANARTGTSPSPPAPSIRLQAPTPVASGCVPCDERAQEHEQTHEYRLPPNFVPMASPSISSPSPFHHGTTATQYHATAGQHDVSMAHVNYPTPEMLAEMRARAAPVAYTKPPQTLAPVMTGSQHAYPQPAPYSNWTPYTGGQLTPLGITPNFNTVSPGFPLPPISVPMQLPSLQPPPSSIQPAMSSGAPPATPWYTPLSANPYVQSPGNSYAQSAGVPASQVNPHAQLPPAPPYLCNAPWLAPQSLASTPALSHLTVPSPSYLLSTPTRPRTGLTYTEPLSPSAAPYFVPSPAHLAPSPAARLAPSPAYPASSPMYIAEPPSPPPAVPEPPPPQTPFAQPPSPDWTDGRSSAGGATYGSFADWEQEGVRGGELRHDLYGARDRAGHGGTDKKVAFARSSESDWRP